MAYPLDPPDSLRRRYAYSQFGDALPEQADPQQYSQFGDPIQSLHRLSADPDAWTQARAAREYEANQRAARQNFGRNSPFLSGVESGWEGLKGSGHGIAALAKGLVGDTEGERASLRAMQQNQANAADLDAGSPASLHDIHGVGDAFTWAEHQLGAALPGIAATIAPALVTGGAGALVSGGLRSAALRAAANEAGEAAISREAASLGADAAAGQAARNVAARAGTTIAEGSTPEQAASIARSAVAERRLPRMQRLVDRISPASTLPQTLGEQTGAVAGGTFVSGGSAASNLSPDMTDQQLKDASGKAALGALGEGALMAIPGLALMNRYGVGEAAKAALAKKMAAPLLKRLLREGGEQAAIGGAIAPATAAANRVVHNWITGQGLTDGLVSPEALSEYLNGAAGGALAGAVLGAPAGLRAGDVKLPALGTRNRAFRLFQRLGKSQDAAAKADAKPAPGTEINLDGTPKASDTEALFHSKLDKLQRVRSEWEQRTFGDVKPLDLNEDHAGAVTIGTTSNVPGAKLFDPAAMKIAQQTYPDDGMKAAMLSLLPDTNDVPRAQRSAAIDATAKAVQHGFDSLSKKDQTNVGRFLNLLPPDKVDGFKQVLGTVGALNDDQRSRLTLAPAKDAESKVAPDAASIGANDEGRAALGTEGGEGTGGLEGRLTERDALPTEELGNVPDAVWKAAQFSGDLSKSTLPRDEQVAIEVPKKGGGTRTAALSLRAAASGLSKTEGGKALLEGETNRKVGAVLGVIGEAATRGEKINPRSIHEGMRVFPDDGDGSGVLTAADAAEIRRRAANNGTPRSQAAAAAQRADMASAAVEKPQSVLGLATRAKADEQRATRGESKQSISEPETPERAAGEGDFNAPGSGEQVFAPREYPGVGTGETMTAKGDAGKARSESLVNRIMAGDKRHEGAVATLKRQYDSAKQMADAAKARGDQAAHGRAVARMKDAAEQAKALRTAHAERRAKLVQQFKDVNADVRFKERGAGENPVQTKTSDAYKDDEARVEKFRKQLGLKLKGASLADVYKAAKAKPSTGKGLDPRTGLLGAIRRMADGDEKLTARLDAIDKVPHPKERVLMTNSEKAAATKEPLELRTTTQKPNAHTSLEHSKLETGDSLDRVSGDRRSVAQTVAAAKKNPAYKALFKAVSDISRGKPKPETLQKNLQGIVDRLSKAFGVEAPEVRLFDRSTVIEHQGEQVSLSDNIGMLQRQRGLPSLMHIRGDLKTHEAVSTVLHEFGHHLQHERFDKLADLDPSRLAITKDFKRWRSQLGENATTRDVRSSRAPFFGTLADLRIGGDERMLRDMDPGEAAKYLTSFSEYFADMTARALTEHQGVQGVVGEFFAKVAHAMRLVYDLLAGNDRKLAEAPQSFKSFVSRTWRDAPEQPPEAAARARAAAANNLAKMPRNEALAAANEAPSNGGTTPPGKTPPPDGASPGGAGGAPSDVTLGMNSRDRGLVEKVVTRMDVFDKILKEFPQYADKDSPLMQYGTQLETAINAAYALWATGKLKLSGDGAGTGYAGAFRRFGEQVKNVFGLKSTQQLGERIFNELKAGTYDMKENVRVKQRRDYLNDLAARAKSAKDVEAAALKGRIALRRSINYALHVNEDIVRPLVDRVLRGLDERLRATNNTDLRKFVSAINRMTGEIGGQEGYVNQIHRITNKRANELSAMVDNAKLSKDDEAMVLKHLMLGGDVPGRPDLTRLRNRIYDFTSQFERSHKQGGSFGHITGGFFPYRFDHAAARANEAEVHSIMSEIGGAGDKDKKLEQGARDYFAAHWAKQHASEFLQTPEARSSMKGRREATTALNTAAKQYADGLNVEALRERMADILLRDPVAHFRASLQDDPFMGSRKPGGGPSLNPRAFGLFDKAGRHDLLERLQKFQSPGIVDTMLPYLHATVKRQTFYDNFVKERSTPESKHLPVAQQVKEQYNVLDDHLAAAKDSGATEKELQLARDYMDAQLGLYGDPNGHPLIQKLFQAVDKQLGTKLGAEDSRTWEKISNAVTTYQNLRVLGLGVLGNMIDPLGNWTRSSSLGTALAGYRKAASAAFRKADNSYLRAHAEALGVAERHALSEGLSWAFNAQGTPGTMSYRINQALFRYNGMQLMTNFARIAALASAHKFLLEHAQLKGPHSQRYLDELGLKASDIKPDAQHPGYVDASSEKVQKALFQFVDEAVVRPHAGHRPLWHADPGFKMLSQYRGFIFSFYDTIMKRMMHEAKHGNLGAVAPLVGYLGVTMAAEMAREMVQYGVNGNPSRKDWGITDRVAHAINRSGALGPRADFMNSAYPELAYSHVPIPYESLTGPTVSQIDDLADMALGQRSTGNTALQALPGESIYHGWVHRGSAKSSHQSAGALAASFADDFVLE